MKWQLITAEMLMTLINVCVGVISVGLAIFFFYPAPPPSPFVFQLEETGKSYLYNDYRIYYQWYHSNSSEETIVLLHGFPTSSFDYYKVVPLLRKHFKNVILLDFLGFGFSDKPRNNEYKISYQADIVESFINSLNVKNINIMSHDYGDTVVQEILARQLENKINFEIKSIALLNGGIFPETNQPLFIQKILSAPIVGPILSRLMNYRTFSIRISDLFGPKSQPLEQELRDMWHLCNRKDGYLNTPKLLSYITQRIEHRDRWVEALQNTKVPIQMIYGPEDVVNPPPFADHFKKLLPNANLHVLAEHVGHYPQIEAPNEVVNAYISFYHKNVLKMND